MRSSRCSPSRIWSAATPITFYDTITVRNSTDTGDSSITIVNYFAQTTSSGGLVGFLPAGIAAPSLRTVDWRQRQ